MTCPTSPSGRLVGQPILKLAALRLVEARHAKIGLMEKAGWAAACWAAQLCRDTGHPILIVAGPGNNGGDALVVARHLHQQHFAVHVVLAGNSAQLPSDARAAYTALTASGITTHSAIPEQPWSLVIDGLFGVGLTRPISGEMAASVSAMQDAARASQCRLLSLDIPSGLDSETGQASGAAIIATHTLSFIALKPGQLTAAGPDHCGQLKLDRLDLTLDQEDFPPADFGLTICQHTFDSALKRRQHDSHKGSFGAAGIVGGAPGMLGAAYLAGRAALHLGSGRVYLGLLDPNAPSLDPQQAELMLRAAEALFDAPLTALAVGPGMGESVAAAKLLAHALQHPLPLVIDADAINLLSRAAALRTALHARSDKKLATVLTPHPAEAARLLDTDVDNLQKNRLDAARQLATTCATWVVLKGCGSIVASPNGAWWINTSGNPGLASAGTGDVLTGFVVSLLAQGMETGLALRLAVHLHGAAADALAENIGGEIGMTAGEVILAARPLLNQWVAQSAK